MSANADFDRLRVVLVETRNPLNIGAAARAMSNFGFSRLRVVNPYDAAFREARSAAGGIGVLAGAEECTSLAGAIGDSTLVVGTTAVRNRELHHPLEDLAKGAAAIREHLASGNVCLLFGSEKFGLSNENLSHCNWLMRIPTGEMNISMNLGQAVAICLYELVRDSRMFLQSSAVPSGAAQPMAEPSKSQPPSASAAEIDRITSLLMEVLHGSGYLNSRSILSADEKIRRLVRRLNIPASDAEVWLGILRQIAWKIHAGSDSEP